MPKLPEYTPQVGIRAIPTPPQEVSAPPEAFGVGFGKAVQGLGQTIGAIAIDERRERAAFDAADRELTFGVGLDKKLADFKSKAQVFQPAPGENYTDGMRRMQMALESDLATFREKVGSELTDPLARKNFEIRTRLQVQAALRHADVAGEQLYDDWRKKLADGQLAAAVRRAGNVSGSIQTDLFNLQAQAAVGLKQIEDYLKGRGVPPEEIQRVSRKAESDMVRSALEAYGSNYSAGLAFLQGKLPGTDITIGYDPQASDKSVLSGPETAKWIDHFLGHKKERVGADLGEVLYQESRTTRGFNLERRLTELFKSGRFAPEEIGKARAQFASAVSEGDRLHDIAIGNMYEKAYKSATTKYDGDLMKALRANDEEFNRTYAALGPKQGNLRAALEKAEDPAAYGPLGQVIDLSSSPGKLASTYPTAGAFTAAFQGPTKHLWPQALKLYERDVQRDVSQDVHYKVFKDDLETRTRRAVGWTRLSGTKRMFWEEAPTETRAYWAWVVATAEQGWADHLQARKQTPSKTSDVGWYLKMNQEIINMAETLKRNGSFKGGGIPEVGALPETTQAIKVQPVTPPPTVKTLTPEQYAAEPSGTWYNTPEDPTPRRKP